MFGFPSTSVTFYVHLYITHNLLGGHNGRWLQDGCSYALMNIPAPLRRTKLRSIFLNAPSRELAESHCIPTRPLVHVVPFVYHSTSQRPDDPGLSWPVVRDFGPPDAFQGLAGCRLDGFQLVPWTPFGLVGACWCPLSPQSTWVEPYVTETWAPTAPVSGVDASVSTDGNGEVILSRPL